MQMKNTLGKLFSVVVFVMLVISASMVARRIELTPRTDDAFLFASIADIAPEVSGRIITLNIKNNQKVNAGDILFVIDPEPFQLKLDSAKAQRKLAASTLVRNLPLVGKGYVTAQQIDQE